MGGGLKIFPGIGTVGGIVIDATVNYITTSMMGLVYNIVIEDLATKGKEITEDAVKEGIKQEFKDKEKIKKMYKQAKEEAKSVDFKKYKNKAEALAKKNKNAKTKVDD